MECLAESMSVDPSKHRQELLERLDILRNNDSFCDVTIAVKDKEFKAHRAVLAAASPFFLTLLTSNMKQSNEQLIKVELEEATETRADKGWAVKRALRSSFRTGTSALSAHPVRLKAGEIFLFANRKSYFLSEISGDNVK